MRIGALAGFEGSGLQLAVAAFCIILCQLVLGFRLRATRGRAQRHARHMHFWATTLIAGLVAMHVILDRA